ncbi:TonB-dependent receptor plug domain-containing protein [Hymenobacter armeniacus]|uniref:TonB-dependent receptor n=1 Tax=Hymenobacter armeniacus TaxID=2771358 RepID=A0ABR8K2B3_9BACT|nr:TonB-dependent receptor [Hymenobacter armeniacus]MBD2724719.1 TonB-dependent receptor [Hymenobacter armeniacus]
MHTRRLAGLLAAAIAVARALPAQGQAAADTLTGQSHRLPDVAVAGSKPSRYALGTRQLVLDSAALSQYRTGTLAEALAARAPLYLKNYGPGQLASISIRGTSARHTAVLWNGFNINFSSLGEADFSLFSVGGNTQVRVQPGPGGALYGTGAIGGAVLLSGEPALGGGLRGSVQAEGGSFGQGAGSLEASYGAARLALRTTALYREAQNDFPLGPEQNGAAAPRQPNAAFRQWNFTQDARLLVGTGGQLSLAAWLTGANRQIQPALGAANRHGLETDHSARLLAAFRQRLGRRYEGTVRVAWLHDRLVYGDDTLLPQYTTLSTTQAQTEHSFTLGNKISLQLGGEVQHFEAVADGYESRIRENRLAAFGLLRYDATPTLRLTANLRQAVVPDQRPPLAPTAGAEWDLWQTETNTITLKASASRSYRAATLNERYYRPGGNPGLLPETGVGYEAGAVYDHQAAGPARLHWRTELTAYRQLVDNWVQWIPGAGGFYSPRNLRLVRTQGLEASTALDWKRPRYEAAVRASYALTQAHKQQGYLGDDDPLDTQLAYVPLHGATLSTEHTWRTHWLLSASGSFSSYRYTTVSANDFLPGYFLLQGSVGRHLTVGQARFTLLVQGYNLTNTRYQTYAGRAMPPRSAVLSLRVAWR